MSQTDPRVAHALAYPFDIPAASFLFAGGQSIAVEDAGPRPDTAGLVPVLVSGSNAAPAQLSHKFSPLPGCPDIPVLRGQAHSVAAVHSCHFAGYGSIPATLIPRPGATTDLFCTFLPPALLPVMHRSESLGRNYDFLRLEDVVFEAHGQEVAAPYAYVSRHGVLGLEGAPVGVAGVPCDDASLPRRPQGALLAHAHACLAPETPFAAFLLRLIEEDAARAKAIDRLKQVSALPLERPAAWRQAS